MKSQRDKREAIDLGARCKACPLKKAPLVLPPTLLDPPKDPRLVIVGEKPGRSEAVLGYYLVGPSGDMVDDMLAASEAHRSQCHITNATMCYSAGYQEEDIDKAVDCCRPRLVRELAGMKGGVILAYGAHALKTTTGKTGLKNWMGAALPGVDGFEKFSVIATYNASFVLRPSGAVHTPAVWVHTDRAVKLADGKLPKWRWPKIIIEPNQAAVDALEEMLDSAKVVGFDTETRGTDSMRSMCGALSLSTRAVSVCVPWEAYSSGKFTQPALSTYPLGKRIAQLVKQILFSESIAVVAHNAAHDQLGAERMKMKIRGQIIDTLPMHALVMPGSFHDLGFACCMEFSAPRWKTEFHATTDEKGTEAFFKRDPRQLRRYCAKDSYMGLRLATDLQWHINQEKVGPEILQQYDDLAPVALRMCKKGVRFDFDAAKIHRTKLGRRLKYAAKQIAELALVAGVEDLNPNSSKQLQDLFFNKLGVRPRYFSALTGKPSLNVTALTDLVGDENELVALLSRAQLRYRKNRKLLDYLDGDKVHEDGILHVMHKYWGARTLRWSSSPNIQNIPKPNLVRNRKTGIQYVHTAGLRNIYVCNTFKDWMVAADYDQIELKFLAQVAGDESLLEIFAKGGDPHKAAAADLFRIAPSEVTKKERDMAKIAQYLIWYGGSFEKLFKAIVVEFPHYTLKAAKLQHISYLQAHAVERYHAGAMAKAVKTKKITAPISKHEVPIFGAVDPNKLYNFPIQHSAADLINPAIIKVDKQIRWRTEGIVAQVHDEIICQGPDPIRLAKILKKAMTTTITINNHTIKFTVGIKMGPSYGDLEEQARGESLEKMVRRIKKMYPKRLRRAV